MSGALNKIEAVLADPLALARQASYSIGYIGLDIPEDLLAADGLFAAHLPWQTGRKTPQADEWLEDSFPGWSRSIIEDWAAGVFDFMPYVIFTRGDDATQRLYYYMCEIQNRGLAKGPKPLMFDIARINKPSSEAWTSAAVKRLAGELGLTRAALESGIGEANQRRELLGKLTDSRQSAGHVYEHIARASLFAPVQSLVTDLPAANHVAKGRILLAGSSPPDDSLHLAVEAVDWSVVCETYDRNLSRLGPPIETGGTDVFERIGRHIHANNVGVRAFHDRAEQLLQNVRSSQADAVIFWLTEEDEGIAWDLVSSQKALIEAGVPCLAMTRRKWDCSDGSDADIASFLEGLS